MKPAKMNADLPLIPSELTETAKWQRAERGFAIIDISLPDGVRIPTLISAYNAVRTKETAGLLLLHDHAIEKTRMYALHFSAVTEGNHYRYATPAEIFDRLARSCGTFYLRSIGHIGEDEQIRPDTLTAKWIDVPLEFEPVIIQAEQFAGNGEIVDIITEGESINLRGYRE